MDEEDQCSKEKEAWRDAYAFKKEMGISIEVALMSMILAELRIANGSLESSKGK
jgi:hypothetical protein